MMKPEPVPADCEPDASIVTTEGDTAFAIAAIELLARGDVSPLTCLSASETDVFDELLL